MKQLAPAEQIERLCNLKAMMQFGAWNNALHPDRIVAISMAGTRTSDRDFVAVGAALHSKRDCYRLESRYPFAPDRQHVIAFEFRLWDVTPKDKWEKHTIPDQDGAADQAWSTKSTGKAYATQRLVRG